MAACKFHGVNEVIYCHTSVGLNEKYVKQTCSDMGWKLNIVRPVHKDEFERFVKMYGFPKPTSHTWIMNRLKTNPIRTWFRKERKKRDIRFISGIRRKESKRRFKNYHKGGKMQQTDIMEGMTFFKPIMNWTKKDVLDYHKLWNLPSSPIYRTMSISGDCFCGAYCKKHESLLLIKHHPELAKKIMDLESKYNKSWGQYMGLTACDGQTTLESNICTECIIND